MWKLGPIRHAGRVLAFTSAFRKKFYQALDELYTDVDRSLHVCNEGSPPGPLWLGQNGVAEVRKQCALGEREIVSDLNLWGFAVCQMRSSVVHKFGC